MCVGNGADPAPQTHLHSNSVRLQQLLHCREHGGVGADLDLELSHDMASAIQAAAGGALQVVDHYFLAPLYHHSLIFQTWTCSQVGALEFCHRLTHALLQTHVLLYTLAHQR